MKQYEQIQKMIRDMWCIRRAIWLEDNIIYIQTDANKDSYPSLYVNRMIPIEQIKQAKINLIEFKENEMVNELFLHTEAAKLIESAHS